MCGIAGIYGQPQAARHLYEMLRRLQHRGQESAGIATSDGQILYRHRTMGHVKEALPISQLAALRGPQGIGHVRYSTSGDSSLENAQPILIDSRWGRLALVHNGNLTNCEALRGQVIRQSGSNGLETQTDSALILGLIAQQTGADNLEEAIRAAVAQLKGAYSLLIMSPDKLYAIRDRFGFRPLAMGQLDKTKLVFASETSAFAPIGADYVEDVRPGSMLVVDSGGLSSHQLFDSQPRQCMFESIYLADPTSLVYGRAVGPDRVALGQQLAKEAPVPTGTIVVAVPDSGNGAAIGYAEALGLSLRPGLVRNHYYSGGRTFIQKRQIDRVAGIREKLFVNRPFIQGQSIVLIDDSIVRGTVMTEIVKQVRQAGASAVHIRVSSPPVRWPCYYGIDTPERSRLAAANRNNEELTRQFNADSLGYLSIEGCCLALGLPATRYCLACFNGDYPVGNELVTLSERRSPTVVRP